MNRYAKKIIKEVKSESKANKKRIAFYVDSNIHEIFHKRCGKIPASRVIEKLMQSFNEDMKKK